MGQVERTMRDWVLEFECFYKCTCIYRRGTPFLWIRLRACLPRESYTPGIPKKVRVARLFRSIEIGGSESAFLWGILAIERKEVKKSQSFMGERAGGGGRKTRQRDVERKRKRFSYKALLSARVASRSRLSFLLCRACACPFVYERTPP